MIEIALILISALLVYIIHIKARLRIADGKIDFWRNSALTMNGRMRRMKNKWGEHSGHQY